MKRILLSLTAMCFSAMAIGQNYYAIKSKGVAGYDLTTMIGLAPIMDKTTNDAMTATQTLPFSFNFYGNSYNTFKASDNGYITFDVAATTSVGTNSDIPVASDPNNAIYAFWGNWEFKAAPNPNFATRITQMTVGTAPNRSHIIQWFGASPQGKAIAANADVLVFGIVLFEGNTGKFDVFYSSYGAASNKGTVGTENIDGTVGFQLTGGKDFPSPVAASTDGAALETYKFFYGTQPALDINLISATMPAAISKNTDYIITTVVANYGSAALTGFKMNLQIDGGTVKTFNSGAINVSASGGTYSYAIPFPINETVGGITHTYKVWVSPITGTDGNNLNDTINGKYLVINGTTAPKTVLFEEATGAWCQHCPDAHGYMYNIEVAHPTDVVIAVHHNQDAMTNTESDLINAAFAQGYPNGYIDRKIFSPFTTVGISRTAWDATINTQLAAYTPVKVNMKNVKFNESTRQITFDVEAEFADYFAGDLRIGAMIKESYIRGIGNGTYDQIISSVYTNQSGHLYFGKSNPMTGYYHRHVIINIPSSAWGSVNSLTAATFAPGDKFSKSYSYTLPAMTTVVMPASASFGPTGTIAGRNKPADISVIGFVAQYNADKNQRNILNSGEQKLWNFAAATSNVTGQFGVSIYPNQADAYANIQFENTAIQDVKVQIMSLSGQLIGEFTYNNLEAGPQTVNINTSDMAAGIYNVIISSAAGTGTAKLAVVH